MNMSFDSSTFNAIAEGSDLSGASFVGARIIGPARDVRFTNADLTDADFSGADIRGSWFDGAKKLRTNFRRANLDEAVFTLTPEILSADFTDVKNLSKAYFLTQMDDQPVLVRGFKVNREGKLIASKSPTENTRPLALTFPQVKYSAFELDLQMQYAALKR